METNTSRTHCIRCGDCCLSSSPTLHSEDIRQIKNGLIHKSDIYTIRIGEYVQDNIRNQIKISDIELIKIREKNPGTGCIYYDENAQECRIYNHRPAQCAAQACWDENEYMKTYKGPKLTRKASIQDNIILGLIAEHEKKCSCRVLEQLVKQIQSKGATALEEILAMLRFDHEIRPFVSKKMGIALNEMDFVFGRPLMETISIFGLQVTKEADGSFFLTVA